MEDAPAPPAAPDDVAPSDSLEAALARTEAAAGRALDAGADLKALRRLRTSAQVGNLRDLRAMLATVAQVAERARDEADRAASSWQLDEDAYFAPAASPRSCWRPPRPTGSSSSSVTSASTATRSWSGRPAERSVFVDRARERRSDRPSWWSTCARSSAGRRFRPEAFLDALFGCTVTSSRHGPNQLDLASPCRWRTSTS